MGFKFVLGHRGMLWVLKLLHTTSGMLFDVCFGCWNCFSPWLDRYTLFSYQKQPAQNIMKSDNHFKATTSLTLKHQPRKEFGLTGEHDKNHQQKDMENNMLHPKPLQPLPKLVACTLRSDC